MPQQKDQNLPDDISDLFRALIHDDFDKVVSLVKKGVDVNVHYESLELETPLVTTICKTNLISTTERNSRVKFLLENGADTELTSHDSCFPIHLAAKLGYLEIVKLLVKYGARLDSRHPLTGGCAIHLATELGYIDMVEYFLDVGVDIELPSSRGTPLLWAADSNECLLWRSASWYKSYNEVVRYLVEKGANINAQNSLGLTALHICARRGFANSIKFLVEAGASVEVKNSGNLTPVEEFFQYQSHLPTAQILIKYMLIQSEKSSSKQYDIRQMFSFHLKCRFPDTHPYTQSLTTFLDDCKTEIKKMKMTIIGNTSISLYTFLHDIYDENKLSIYLNNENIRKELKDIKYYLKNFPIYSSVNIAVKSKIKFGENRLDLVKRACEVMDKEISPILPTEIKLKIFDHLSVSTLYNFINAVDTRKSKLSTFMNKIFWNQR